MYNDYKQQYAFGFAPISLADLGAISSSSTKFFLGEACGAKANLSKVTGDNDSTHTKPIDFKAPKQMFHKKALLDVEVIESIAPMGAKQTATLTFTGTKATAAGSYTIAIKDEDGVTVTVAEDDTPSDIAAAVVTALGGLKAWVASAAAGVVTITKKVESANITVNSDNFGFTGSATGISVTSSGFVAGTTGVAPEADPHVIKLDFFSADADAVAAYVDNSFSGLTPDHTVYVKPGEAIVCNTPYFQSLMASLTKQYAWVELSVPYAGTASITYTAGKLLIHCNPN
jgi:hypothetical protein